jgi:hypothetical protein
VLCGARACGRPVRPLHRHLRAKRHRQERCGEDSVTAPAAPPGGCKEAVASCSGSLRNLITLCSSHQVCLLPKPQGEAIAFALGGNARMMRARSLAALVNASPGISAAVVTLHLDILPQQSTSPGPTMPSDSGTEGSAVLHTATPLPPAATAPVGRLLIRRRVNRAGRSDFAVLQSAADGARGVEAAGKGDDGQAGAGQLACGEWQAVGPEALRGLLAPLGIQAEAVDRRVAALGWGCVIV